MKSEIPPQLNPENTQEDSPKIPEQVASPEPTLAKKIGDFSSAVANERTLSYEQGITNPQELEEEKNYNEYVSRQLATLKKDSLTDSEVSDALADLSFRSFHYRESLKQAGNEGQAEDPDQKERFEAVLRLHKTAKSLFMESMRKLYPDMQNLGITRASFAEFERKAKLLNPAFPGFLEVATISAIQKNNWAEREKNPGLLLNDLDDMISRASVRGEEVAKQNAFDSFEADKEKEVTNKRANLAELNSLIYEMELVRNQLQQKIYGGSEISPIDEGKVDALKAGLDKPEQENKPENPIYEKVTDENFDKYHQQGKELIVNGKTWQVNAVKPDGNVILGRSLSMQEALQSIEDAKRDGTTLLPSSIDKAIQVSLKDLKSGDAQWIIEKPLHSPSDSERQKEVDEVRQLQARIASGEFDKNEHGEGVILNIFDRNAQRLNKERQDYEAKYGKKT